PEPSTKRRRLCIGYSTKITKRIYAERNIVSETNSNSMEINGYGNGATQIISNFLNKALYTEDTVKIDLLKKLNEIMGEDANFTEILTQQINITGESEQWEIFLKEDGKTRIALSQSGSGLKTILMVLIFTILVPKIENKNISDYIFLFEELENNLHPSLERRLLQYIEELSNRGAIFFLTTHSSTILNSFQNSENVQIYHIVKSENSTKVVSLDNILGKNACLNDLGIKASDILQANGIIWVEGPSDRIYINKWIDLWSNGKFREGIHYQCVFYGGRLLNNLSADEENINDLVNLINVNRNAVILIDSDKKSKAAPISSTKQRIQNEFQKNSQLCWITQGREIENYIPKSIIESFYNTNSNKDFKQYQKIDSFLENFSKNDSKNFSNSKIKFAKYFSNNMTLKNMKTSLDIDGQMIKIITEIEKWNLK
ncbi:MAG TPA: ATP-binding protein, partial [Candidatus Scatovivens faecipullorum]|nr:ATP-binding protein [Candidatus Scatovivens faecipullorum]